MTRAIEADYPYFKQGFVDADRPRDAAYTTDIVDATVGWAVADAEGNVLAEFQDYQEAVKVRDNATFTLNFALPSASPI